jgi:ADP-heptose:LPS heptosyltransferase
VDVGGAFVNPVRQVERGLRFGVVYPLLRLLISNRSVDLPLDLHAVRRLLLLRTDRLGDMVVTSSFVRRLKERAPQLHLGMVVSDKGLEAAKLIPGIDRLHVVGSSAPTTIRALVDARREQYDVVLNLVFNRTTLGGVLANVIASRSVKVGQGAETYRFFFNAMVRLERGRVHMARTLESFGIQTFGPGFAGPSLPYALRDDPDSEQRICAFIERMPKPPILVNLSAGERPRAPRPEQMRDLVGGILVRTDGPIVVSAAPGEEDVRGWVVRSVGDPRVCDFPLEGRASFADMVALVRRSRMLVTPDTSLVHVAGATTTPMLGLYSTAFSLAEWSPLNTLAEIVITDGDRPLAEMPVVRMLEGFDRLLKKLTP